MCLRIRPGTLSGPAALWLGVRRNGSCMMVGVMQPEIIGIEDAGVGWMCHNHGTGAPGGSVGSGDKAAVSMCAILATTSAGAVMRWPVISSRMMEIYWKDIGVLFPLRCSHNGVERRASFFHKQA